MFGIDDEEEDLGGLYEDGHWVWDENKKQLEFRSDVAVPEDDFAPTTPAIFGPIEFKDDIDLMEQQRFRKRFQRRPEGDDDVIMLQDIKDLVLYTAPSSILTPTVVNIMHLSTTDRFIRALIFYFQYYLQIADEMAKRVLELETKVRTNKSYEVELELRDNLEDLRLLVAKEYCTMVLGGADYKKFHHMGPNKKMRSLSKKDALIFESILRICMQITWLALGRQSFNQIELETNRMFKSQIFNMTEHKLKTNYIAKMSSYERFVLLGHCVNEKQKLNMLSPLMNETLCHRPIDFRMLGLGTIKIPTLTFRLRYIDERLSMDERLFEKNGISLGILGMPRSRFDTMLREIKMTTTSSTSSASMRGKSVSRTSRVSMKKSTMIELKLYGDIDLPSKNYDREWFPNEFPMETIKPTRCNPVQRLRWMARAARLAGKHFSVVRRYRNIRLNMV
ncbi:protein phosphatase 1 regulatory subunit 36-like isoform X1 [Ostrinia furnacalis]|uniref:protein phosphatase 1 regulatory subunit 36-like isoform X1 n=1 Tax=Ostrinia furnacalis TaxID=93504 RepID=UPI00103BA97B|nr:protein phosphatase 1 regulatory subunit 36-like isoform X1 [Ostrinia furnacalis]